MPDIYIICLITRKIFFSTILGDTCPYPLASSSSPMITN